MGKRNKLVIFIIIFMIFAFSSIWIYFYNVLSNFLGDSIYIIFFVAGLGWGVNMLVNELDKKHKIKLTKEDKARANDFKEYLTEEFQNVKPLPYSKIDYSIIGYEARRKENGHIICNVTHEFKNEEEFSKFFDIPKQK